MAGVSPTAMRSTSPRPRRVGLVLALVVFGVVALLVNNPMPATASASARPTPAQTSPGISAHVTWNGVNISTLGSVSSALSIDFAQSANLDYVWSNAPAPGVNDARLQMYYFGFAVATRDVGISVAETSNSGLPLNWTPLSIGYVLEGVYRLTASLIAKNGTTVWSENFYVRGNAPLGFVAVIPIVLLVIGVYEVYGLARSGRYALLGRKEKPKPPSGPPAATPPSAGTTGPSPPETSPVAEEAPETPPGESPSGPGGGS